MRLQPSTWALVLSATSSQYYGPFLCYQAQLIISGTGVLASPLASSSYKQNAETDLVDRQFTGPNGTDLGPGPVCTLATCDFEDCAEAPICQNNPGKKRSTYIKLVGRQFACPTGLECGPGPVCTAATCSISGCADAAVCQPNNKRSSLVQRDCPPFLFGPECGPPCTATTCDFEDCAEAEVCQGYVKRGGLLDRGLGCPPDIPCGHGPVCTAATCGLAGCADAEVCQDIGNSKRSAETDIVYPVCDICYVDANGATVCGCAHPSGGKERRGEDEICPDFCIVTDEGETLCGCAAEAYEKSLQG